MREEASRKELAAQKAAAEKAEADAENDRRNLCPPGMVYIPDGEFTMGDNLDHTYDAVEHKVKVSGFYMDSKLISLSQWQATYNWAIYHGYDFVNNGSAPTPSHPVVDIDWHDAVKWCNARSQQEGLTPAYYDDSTFSQVYTGNDIKPTQITPLRKRGYMVTIHTQGKVLEKWELRPFVNWKANGYRLPTEAEWEKATRGGSIGKRFPWGNEISETNANYYGNTRNSYDLGPDGYNFYNSKPGTTPVGTFAPNSYGLYDMAGNVWEWCWDWYGEPYLSENNPIGPQIGNQRVMRGGSWGGSSSHLRCANRGQANEQEHSNDKGFRCVRSISLQKPSPTPETVSGDVHSESINALPLDEKKTDAAEASAPKPAQLAVAAGTTQWNTLTAGLADSSIVKSKEIVWKYQNTLETVSAGVRTSTENFLGLWKLEKQTPLDDQTTGILLTEKGLSPFKRHCALLLTREADQTVKVRAQIWIYGNEFSNKQLASDNLKLTFNGLMQGLKHNLGSPLSLNLQ